MNNSMQQALQDLLPYRGTRCEVDLIACQLTLSYEDGRKVIIDLPAEKHSSNPVLQTWGHGLCLLQPNGEMRNIAPWQPGLNYGLMLSQEGTFLIRPDDAYQQLLARSQQLIYPGFYARRQAQGPFDLFVSDGQELLAVVNRSEAQILIIETHSGEEIARHHFKDLAGPKVVSVALDAQSRTAWICGPDDRRLWRWDFDREHVEPVTGDWRYPSALALADNKLWLLDSQQQTLLHGLSLPDLESVERVSLEGSSYAQSTDTPGDLLMVHDTWLAVMTQVNQPDPLTPHVSVIQTQNRGRDREFQPSGRTWPMLFGQAYPNDALREARSREPLNQQLAQEIPAGVVQALLASYRLSVQQLESSLLILSASPGPVLPGNYYDQVLSQVRAALKQEHNLILPATAQTVQQQEVFVQAARLGQLLKNHVRIEAAMLNIMGNITLSLILEREELTDLKPTGTELYGGSVHAEPVKKTPWQSVEALAPGWVGLADPLNSRILQLGPSLEVAWSLETNLFGVYRPQEVCWLPDQAFIVLDAERNLVSSWNKLGRQDWSIGSDSASWSRVVYFSRGEESRLLLIDSQQGRLMSCDPQAQPEPMSEAGQALDVCAAGGDSFWLLEQGAVLRRGNLQGEWGESHKLEGHPSCLALSSDGETLALFDGQIQKLWLWRAGELTAFQLTVSSPRYRINQPLNLQWRNEHELVLHDAYRLLVLDARNGEILHQVLMQELKLSSSQNNLAPVQVFSAQAERENGLLGGSQSSLIDRLRRVPLFQDVSRDFLRELVGHLRTQIFNRGDQIVRRGEAGEDMFLIRQGNVEVLDTKQQVVARIGAGDIFGEVSLMLSLPRNATVRASGYCELFVLKQADLDALMLNYPEIKERLLLLARDRQQQEQLRTEADQEHLRTRIQVLMAQKKQAISPTKVGTARVQTEADSEDSSQSPLSVWVQHPQSGQMACVNRQGQISQLLGPQQQLVQAVAALGTPNGTWVLDMGLNSLLLLESERTRLTLSQWGDVFLAQPRAMADTAEGALWIANTGRSELIQISSSGELLHSLPCGRAPAGIQALANGNLLVTDVREHTVREITPQGQEVWRYGTPRKFGRDENLLFAPEYAERLANGNTLIADTGNSRILEVAADLRIVWSLASGTGLRVIRPTKASRLSNGNTLIEHSNHFYWLEITPDQIPVWRYTLPVRGFSFAEV